jgi:nucleoside-diphosphate-sugar epimerase
MAATKRALILGGTGQIGRAAAPALQRDGFEVTLASRTGTGIGDFRSAVVDREDTAALLAAANRFDLVVDTVAFTPAHAEQLLRIDTGNLIVISTASVYADDAGRFLDIADERGFPEYPDPVTAEQPTVQGHEPGYSAEKAAMERVLLAGTTPVSVLRPAAIHGPGSRAPRELYFVQRALDGRRTIPLAFDARSRFSTSATVNIAELIAFCARHPGTRALNAVDDETPTVGEMARTILDAMGSDADIVPLEGPPIDGVGGTPWSMPTPFVLSMQTARDLGYAPAATYADAVRAAAEWIADELRQANARGEDWRAAFPAAVGRADGWFDYDAEDAALGERGRRIDG